MVLSISRKIFCSSMNLLSTIMYSVPCRFSVTHVLCTLLPAKPHQSQPNPTLYSVTCRDCPQQSESVLTNPRPRRRPTFAVFWIWCVFVSIHSREIHIFVRHHRSCAYVSSVLNRMSVCFHILVLCLYSTIPRHLEFLRLLCKRFLSFDSGVCVSSPHKRQCL